MKNRILPFSFTTSFLLHTLILGSFFHHQEETKKQIKASSEIVYHLGASSPKNQPSVINQKPTVYKVESIVKKEESLPAKVIPVVDKREFSEPTRLSQNIQKQPSFLSGSEKPLMKVETSLHKKEAAVPVLEKEKISNPKYFQYSDLIRDKIKRKAYHYIDNPHFEKGEVYLTFRLSSTGNLQQLQIVDNKTKANDYLRSVGLRSIKEASPFPSFPRDLPYPELSFNVVISFESGEVQTK